MVACAAGVVPGYASSIYGADKSGKLALKVAGYEFDRVAGLVDGRVQVEGCDTSFEVAGIGDMNTDVFGGQQSRDVTGIGPHPFMLAYADDRFRDYSLLPIFPLRAFRHKSIFVNTDGGIRKPEDLRGRRVITPGFSSTSLTWLRGMAMKTNKKFNLTRGTVVPLTESWGASRLTWRLKCVLPATLDVK